MQAKPKRIKREQQLMYCPFCGGSADVFTSYDTPEKYHVKCEMCHSRTGMYRDPTEAVKAWNTRATDEWSHGE